jgi:hypothetical protein
MRACAAATVALILALASCGSSGLRGRQLQAWGPHLRCQGFAEVGARGGTPLGLGAMKLRGGAKDEGVLGTSSATKGEASIGGDSFNMKEKNLWEEEADEVLGRASWEDGFSSGDGEEQGEEEDDGEDDEDDDTGTRAWFERMRKESQQTYEVPEDLVHVEETGLEGADLELFDAVRAGLKRLIHTPGRGKPHTPTRPQRNQIRFDPRCMHHDIRSECLCTMPRTCPR